MTGYGFAELQNEEISATVEVKSVNNRFLDVNVSLPGTLAPFEPAAREAVGEFANRGRVDVFVRVREHQESVTVSVDEIALVAYLNAIGTLRERAGIEDPVRLSDLLAVEGIIRSERDVDRDGTWERVEPVLREALSAFSAHRATEGERTQADILEQFSRVVAALEEIRAHEDEIDSQVRTNLGDRFREVVGDGVDEQRVLAEVAAQLVRFSIHEEIARLAAHIDAFRATMGSDGAVGKKLDFICQEMHREINTIGSKSIVLEISRHVVEAKDALENVREQLRNVE
jgi:uncharacterized protein (TIGR00255 family)